MTYAIELLLDAFGRVREEVHDTIEGLDDAALRFRPDGTANSIGWLIWHLTRIQDDHVADAADREQVWTAEGFYDRFELPFDASATGYAHTGAEVAAVTASAELLLAYHDAVHARTAEFLTGLDDDALATVVDENWDPPVTLSVRLISVISDDLQHVGQAAYARGLAQS
jgi:uncharacterized damage-inducible protein DinB